jgi:hypothetical protein
MPLTVQFHTPDTDSSTHNVQTDGVLTVLSVLNGDAAVQVFCDVMLRLHFISLLNAEDEGVCSSQTRHTT